MTVMLQDKLLVAPLVFPILFWFLVLSHPIMTASSFCFQSYFVFLIASSIFLILNQLRVCLVSLISEYHASKAIT